MRNRFLVYQALLALYGAIGLAINTTALARPQDPLSLALLAVALVIDLAAIYAALRLPRRARRQLDVIVFGIIAILLINTAVAAWRGGAPFYYIVYGIYAFSGTLVWWAVLTGIHNRGDAMLAEAEREPGGPTDEGAPD